MSTSSTRDIVIIGGGHNGLVTAFYLAKAGFKPLVLERRPQVGGAAITDEFHPGFRCSTLAHTAGPVRADIVRDMQLEKHGLRFITPEPASPRFRPMAARFLCIRTKANPRSPSPLSRKKTPLSIPNSRSLWARSAG